MDKEGLRRNDKTEKDRKKERKGESNAKLKKEKEEGE